MFSRQADKRANIEKKMQLLKQLQGEVELLEKLNRRSKMRNEAVKAANEARMHNHYPTSGPSPMDVAETLPMEPAFIPWPTHEKDISAVEARG